MSCETPHTGAHPFLYLPGQSPENKCEYIGFINSLYLAIDRQEIYTAIFEYWH